MNNEQGLGASEPASENKTSSNSMTIRDCPLGLGEHDDNSYKLIKDLVSKGVKPQLALQFAGFSRSKFKEYMQEGELDHNSHIYTVSARVYEAVIQGQNNFVNNIYIPAMSVGAMHDWKAVQQMAKNVDSADFGDNASSEEAEPVQIVNDIDCAKPTPLDNPVPNPIEVDNTNKDDNK